PNGGKEYYRHGKWRRLDGPAVDGAGVLPDEWWIDGQRYTEADWRIKTGGTITGLTPVTGPDLQYPHNPFVEPTETPIQCDHPEHARYPERNGKTGCYKCSAIFD
ncbi:MAG TPA: hypothetical protein VKN14_05570, partial [Flavobacteriaceae bacterium]|nr:hypothetical protein [Flavobacteriaceae bacterium]